MGTSFNVEEGDFDKSGALFFKSAPLGLGWLQRLGWGDTKDRVLSRASRITHTSHLAWAHTESQRSASKKEKSRIIKHYS